MWGCPDKGRPSRTRMRRQCGPPTPTRLRIREATPSHLWRQSPRWVHMPTRVGTRRTHAGNATALYLGAEHPVHLLRTQDEEAALRVKSRRRQRRRNKPAQASALLMYPALSLAVHLCRAKRVSLDMLQVPPPAPRPRDPLAGMLAARALHSEAQPPHICQCVLVRGWGRHRGRRLLAAAPASPTRQPRPLAQRPPRLQLTGRACVAQGGRRGARDQGQCDGGHGGRRAAAPPLARAQHDAPGRRANR